jgi:hypothetical protein
VILVTGHMPGPGGDRTEWSIGEALIGVNYRVSGASRPLGSGRLDRNSSASSSEYSRPCRPISFRITRLPGPGGDRTEWSIGEALIGVNYRVSGKQAAYVFASRLTASRPLGSGRLDRNSSASSSEYSRPCRPISFITGHMPGPGGDRTEWSIGEALIGVNYRVSGKQAAYVSRSARTITGASNRTRAWAAMRSSALW